MKLSLNNLLLIAEELLIKDNYIKHIDYESTYIKEITPDYYEFVSLYNDTDVYGNNILITFEYGDICGVVKIDNITKLYELEKYLNIKITEELINQILVDIL